MKRLWMLTCVLFSFIGNSVLFAQNLKGVILDEETQFPVVNANVYFEGTSVFTITDTEGKFEIPLKGVAQTPLIISHVAYESITIEPPFVNMPEKIEMKVKMFTLGEVVVEKGKFSRAQMLKAFKWQFFGNTIAGASCRVLNEDKLHLHFDLSEATLSVFCDEPVIVENVYLGYILTIDLNRFEVIYKNPTLRQRDVMNVIYEGTSFFKDIKPDNRRYIERREEVYTGSPVHFFRTLLGGGIHKSKYELYLNERDYKERNIYKSIDVTNTSALKKIDLSKDLAISGIEVNDVPVFTKIRAVYDKKTYSDIVFFTDELVLDGFYNISNYNEVLLKGAMGEQRIGDLLPLEYGLVTTPAQPEENTLFMTVAQRLHAFEHQASQEKIYLHQDRTRYIAGETIWFKAYQFSSSRNPVESGVVYVELIDGRNQSVAQTKWKLENGSAAGHIELSDTLVSGRYLIRAYTQWMRNFGAESFFTREIQVASPFAEPWGIETDFSLSGNTLSAALWFSDLPRGVLRYKLRLNGEETRAFPLNPDEDGEVALEIELPEDKEYEGTQFFIVETPEGEKSFPVSLEPPVLLTLFPEGGNLVAGLPSKIAFKITDRQGKGIAASGVIVDDEGKEVRQFNTLHLGHGYFYFEPENGRRYTARLKEHQVSVPLPLVYPQGMVMDVRRSEDRLRIALKHNLDTLRMLRPFFLTVHQKGSSWFNAYIDMSKEMTVLDIPFEKLPDGLFTLTIYDESLQAYCERLAFVNYPEPLNIQLNAEKEIVGNREKTVFQLKAGDRVRRGDFSVAVVKAGLDDVETRNNFYTDHYLQSELKGRIEAPASYFEKRDTASLNNLDLLLLTQGWRRYDWDYKVSGKSPELYYPVEKNLSFSGQVQLRNRDKNLEDIQINALFQRDSIEYIVSAHPGFRGAFRFEGYDFCDTMDVAISAIDKKNRTLYLSITEHEETPSGYYTYGTNIGRNENDSLVVELSGTIPLSPGEEMDKKIHQLPEVSVTAKVKKRDHRRLHNEVFNLTTYSVVKNHSYGGKWGALGILFYVGHVWASDSGEEELTLRVFGSDKNKQPVLILDGFRANQQVLRSVTPMSIERVEVVSPASAMLYNSTGGGAILFFSRSWEDMVDMIPTKTVVHQLVGYSRPKEFYSPDYAIINDPLKADSRNTLYWQPDLSLNEEGEAEFSFFTSDEKGEYLIHCEGWSEEERIGVMFYRINTN